MTPEQLAALQARLAEPRYAGLDVPDILARLRETNPDLPPKRMPVPVVAAVNHLRETGLWYAVMAAAQAGNFGAMAAIELNSDPRTVTLDLDKPIVAQMLGAMQAAPAVQGFDAAAAAAFMALGDVPKSDADDLGFAPGIEDVLAALGKPLFILDTTVDEQGG